MNNIYWILWIVMGVILVIAELFTPGFILLWFGIGAFAAALAAVLGVSSLALQFVIFVAVSVSLTAASRTVFVNYFSRKKKDVSLTTGLRALPGKIGTVVSSSRGPLNEGAVKVLGSTWTAYPIEGEEPLEAGDRVTIERMTGASVYVRRSDLEPDWRRDPDADPKRTV